MPRQPKRRNRATRMSSSSTRHKTDANRNESGHAKETEGWVGSSLLSAMDTMEQHVQEMLDLGRHPAQRTVSSKAAPVPESATLKAYITREINARVEAKLGAIVDTAIMARMNRLEASHKIDQTNINALQASRNYDCQMLNGLDAFHLYEHNLNGALVERLFQTALLEGDPDVKFDETTFDLQGTDSVNSVLVSHVETLVMKVQRLEEQVKRLQEALREIGAA